MAINTTGDCPRQFAKGLTEMRPSFGARLLHDRTPAVHLEPDPQASDAEAFPKTQAPPSPRERHRRAVTRTHIYNGKGVPAHETDRKNAWGQTTRRGASSYVSAPPTEAPNTGQPGRPCQLSGSRSRGCQVQKATRLPALHPPWGPRGPVLLQPPEREALILFTRLLPSGQRRLSK